MGRLGLCEAKSDNGLIQDKTCLLKCIFREKKETLTHRIYTKIAV